MNAKAARSQGAKGIKMVDEKEGPQGDPGGAPRVRIGDELQRRGLLTDSQLQVALGEQKRVHRPLGEIVVSLGFVRSIDTARILSEQLGIPIVSADALEPESMILDQLDRELVRKARAFPIKVEAGTLTVAMVDPSNPKAIALIRGAFPYPLYIVMVTANDLEILLRRYSAGGGVSTEVADILGRGMAVEDDRRIAQLADAVITDGIRRGATDVHVQPEEFLTRIRYRIDGVLRSAESLPHEVSDAVVSRLKISARLDIAERRRPQDGRIRMSVDGRDIDLRMSVMPNVHGENVVLRVLDRAGGVPPLEELGVDPVVARELALLAQRPHGLFLVTGPTGSGKTTTLYALLSRVDSIQRNVATIEDPVEYSVPLVRQSQVDTAVGYGFHEGLRALLRQDPDVILVGEIRDELTADMAIKAAMTGHLVLATLHTTDALGAIPRLIDLGVPSYILEDTLLAVMGQRLVRKLCSRCSVKIDASHGDYSATERWLCGDLGDAKVADGCAACDGSGFLGRLSVSEVFMPSAVTRPYIRSAGQAASSGAVGADSMTLEQAAAQDGFKDLGVDAAQKVRAGLTTLTEILRVHTPADLAGDSCFTEPAGDGQNDGTGQGYSGQRGAA
ncbi:MAG: type IV pilus assembly protein PilB [Planctomycetota bacterium]